MRSLVVAACMVLSHSALAGVVRGPVLHASAPGTMSVTWDTDTGSVGRILYGLHDSLDQVASESGPSTHHVVFIEGLQPWSLYRFQIEGELDPGTGGTFRVSGLDRQPFGFTVAGDTRTQPFYHRVVLDRVMATRPLLHLNTGDLVESGERADQWDEFFTVERDLLRHVPLLPVIGNHDKDMDTLYHDIWSLAGVRPNAEYFSLRTGNVLFVALDYGLVGSGDTDQDHWLEQELAAAAAEPGIDHVVPMFHVPPLSSGPHGNASNGNYLGYLHPLFVQHGVRLVLNGHDHDYERSWLEGVHYVVAGGGGAPQRGGMADPPPNPQEHSRAFAYEFSFARVDVDGERMVLSAWNMDGDRIERVELAP